MTDNYDVLTITQLNRQIKLLLENFEVLWVEGEISNLSKPASGHYYFTLKDSSAQIRCVYFRNRHNQFAYSLENGQLIQASGKLSLYEARGDYQLIVESIRAAGEGDLYRQFELLKKKLAAQGFFDTQRKRPIPKYPESIGVVTSSNGAALHDIVTTLKRRYPLARLLIYPCEVQGMQAPAQLIRALSQANFEKQCDVLILARGGGSIEDLWAFNDEALAYTIARSDIPVVVGVGHETDFTIADFVADLRAATPTAAAEAVTPNRHDIIQQLIVLENQMAQMMHRQLEIKQMYLVHILHKLTSPKSLVLTHWQTIDYLRHRLQQAIQKSLIAKKHVLYILLQQLKSQNPKIKLIQLKKVIQTLEAQIVWSFKENVEASKTTLTSLMATLHAVSPLATLERGYAIVSKDQHILKSAANIEIGECIDIRLARGRLTSKVIHRRFIDEADD